jgi:hypothetical protein
MKRLLSLLMVTALSVSMIGCGKNSRKLVTDISVETRDQDDSKYVTTDFKMDLGATELPFLHLPLPKNYGHLRTYRMNGENYVALDLNLTEVLKLPGDAATLPNGTMVPVDTHGAGIIQILVPGINGRVYVSQKDDMTLVGFAFTIKQLDGLGREIGTVGVFPNFDIKKIKMTAGVFTGENGSQTGIAVFANLGGLWSGFGEKLAVEIPYDASAFEFTSEQVANWKLKRMYNFLNRMKNTQQVLELAK